MAPLPLRDVGHRQVVVDILRHLVGDVDHHQRSHCIGRRQVADRRAQRAEVRWGVKLGAVLIGRQLVRRGHKAMRAVAELVAFLREPLKRAPRDGRLELRMAKSRPHRLRRMKGMRELNVLRVFQRVVVDAPQALCGGWGTDRQRECEKVLRKFHRRAPGVHARLCRQVGSDCAVVAWLASEPPHQPGLSPSCRDPASVGGTPPPWSCHRDGRRSTQRVSAALC